MVLIDQGYRVVEACDGMQAIQALDGQLPATGFSLVLLDMMLPGVDGLGVLDHLTTQSAVPPVVAMSARPDRLAAARSAGAHATIHKPFDLDDLLKTVARNCTPRPEHQS
jgi:CheY-like chemotaxis protein